MKNTKPIVFGIIFLFTVLQSITHAQTDSIQYNFGGSALLSTGQYSPFWLHSNRYGSISERGSSFNAEAGFLKPMNHTNANFDYGFGVQAIFLNDNQKSILIPQEYFAQARWRKAGVRIGAMKEHYGNQDSTLSAGGFMFSTHSRPMPKLWAGIDKFVDIPFTKGYMEVRGGISHGWINDKVYEINPFLHHKYIYFRAGGNLPVNLQYGLDHVAQWGGKSPSYGLQPSSLSDLAKVFFAKSGGNDASQPDQINVLGNHIISQSMKLEVQVSDYLISTYWQNFTEDTPFRLMWQTMNVVDGVWGVSVRNKKFPIVKAFLYEFINTTDQSGPYHDKDGIVYGGNDSYMTNGVYSGGWTYFGATIGTPFISSAYYNNDGYTQTYNSRIQAHHFGVEGESCGLNFKALASFTSNFGIYEISGHSMKSQNSFLAEFSGKLPKSAQTYWMLSAGADFGKLRGNSIGILLGIKHTGLLVKY